MNMLLIYRSRNFRQALALDLGVDEYKSTEVEILGKP